MIVPPDIELCVENEDESLSLLGSSDRSNNSSISSLILGKSRYGSLGSLQVCQKIVRSIWNKSKKVSK